MAPASQLEKTHEFSNAAASTPVTDGERVYVYFGSCGLLAYNFAGEQVWTHPLPLLPNRYGTATSPVVFGGRRPRPSRTPSLSPMSEVTRILAAMEQGERRAAEELPPLVYQEPRNLAAVGMRRDLRPPEALGGRSAYSGHQQRASPRP